MGCTLGGVKEWGDGERRCVSAAEGVAACCLWWLAVGAVVWHWRWLVTGACCKGGDKELGLVELKQCHGVGIVAGWEVHAVFMSAVTRGIGPVAGRRRTGRTALPTCYTTW